MASDGLPGMPSLPPVGSIDGMTAYHFEIYTSYVRAGFPPPYALQLVIAWMQIGAQASGPPADET